VSWDYSLHDIAKMIDHSPLNPTLDEEQLDRGIQVPRPQRRRRQSRGADRDKTMTRHLHHNVHCAAVVIALALSVPGTASVRADELDQSLTRARKTLEFVQRSRPCPALAARLRELEQRSTSRDANRTELHQNVRQLRRQIIFSHPLLDFDRLLVNKCPPPAYSHQSRQYLGRYSRPGPGLVVLDNWKDSPRETRLLAGQLPAGTVMHPDLSFDARRVVFAFCDHTPADPNLRQFFLWEVGIDGQGLRQLTGKEADRLAGAEGRQTALIEDFDPCYLPDGEIVFVSTRTQTHIRCQYGFRYFANFLLYRADANGEHIRPLSFAEAPEWEPSLLDDGRIVYSRWDYTNRHSYHFQSPWVSRPDGTGTANVYGNLTRNPINTAEPRQVPGSQKIVCTAMAHHGYTAGSLVLVDPRRGLDGLPPLERITPEIAFPEMEGWPEGAYANPFPLSEDLFLAAYTPDKLAKEGQVQSVAAYGIYLVDTLGGRELIYRDPAMSCFSPIPVQPRPRPPVLPSATAEEAAGETQEKAEPGTGVFYVENVYRSTQPLAAGSVKRLRVVRVFPQTVESPPSRSITPYEMPKQLVGTAPVGEDGSVAFRAPAGQPLFFQLLDENGMAVMTMRALVYLQAGERASCVGCHEPRHVAPERRRRWQAGGFAGIPGISADGSPHAPTTIPTGAAAYGAIVHDLQPPVGPRYEGGLSFARTVQPVLDRYCIECHGVNKTEGDLDLLGTLEPVTFDRKQWPGPNKMTVSRAYRSLVTREGLIKVAHADMETDYSTPKDYFAHAGRLAKMLLAGHPDKAGKPLVQLDCESFQRIVDWLDLNAVYYGDYSWNKLEWREPSPDGQRALREEIRRRFGPHLAEQPLAALVNIALPEESRILQAPLAAEAGGWGLWPERAWRSGTAPGYVRMRELVRAAIAPLAHHDLAGTCGAVRAHGLDDRFVPLAHQDLAGTCGRPDRCLCDCCWVRLHNAQNKAPGGSGNR
jgi:hypothetical protein